VIVPRWEWRAFADDFGEADRRFDGLDPERVEESDETYVVVPTGDASVKVRDSLIDVKRLVVVDDDGLEQWTPVLKAPVQLAAAEVRVLLDALHVTGVRVHKRRAHYTVGGCMAERSDISSDDWAVRTIAVESEDPARVAATVRDLGFDPHGNTSLPRELALLTGG
jgi:exopolyphosphatase / guanosine-5'-triphosphate,3'-diphosphate pyrophosphatase